MDDSYKKIFDENSNRTGKIKNHRFFILPLLYQKNLWFFDNEHSKIIKISKLVKLKKLFIMKVKKL
jgi:hypothetical protein